MMIRLEAVSKELVEKLAAATSGQRKKAVILACEHALQAASLSIPIVDYSLEKLRQGEIFSSQLMLELNALAERLDNEYFELQEESGESSGFSSGVLSLFSQARAVSALAFAGGEESIASSAESIYEASAAVDDSDALLKIVLGEL